MSHARSHTRTHTHTDTHTHTHTHAQPLCLTASSVTHLSQLCQHSPSHPDSVWGPALRPDKRPDLFKKQPAFRCGPQGPVCRLPSHSRRALYEGLSGSVFPLKNVYVYCLHLVEFVCVCVSVCVSVWYLDMCLYM